MSEQFFNVYADQARAASYDKLEFPGTYYLAFRDLPAIIRDHVAGPVALDFGCGAGRSTRFLKGLGLSPVTGVDISEPMVARARGRDPGGDYLVVEDGELGALTPGTFDLVLSAFTFDNIPTREKKVTLFRGLKDLLKEDGRILNLVSSPEIYINEWASFSTRDFPENRQAKSGDKVRIVMLDVEDRRPVEDIIWFDDAYQDIFQSAGLRTVRSYRPLAAADEPYAWVSETEVAPWVIYVLAP